MSVHPNVDLIYLDEDGKFTMSCSVVYGGMDKRDRLLGPVPGQDSVKALAPLLADLFPDELTTEKAIALLTVVHMRNMVSGTNSAGLAYPYVVRAR